ncbi:MAG: DUF1987 domain-containing protein [Rhodocyclaceae bacterium]|nr:DUF1987 domain-containing protein [Rhodocyclaceae bacterium]
MENLYIPATNETPEINFRFTEHKLHINGESYPENAMAFYAPIRASLNDYLSSAHPQGEVEAHISLKYFNSSSTKLIRSMIALMHDSAQAGKRIVTHWYHDPDDDMMSEFGNDLKDEFRMMDIRVVALEPA